MAKKLAGYYTYQNPDGSGSQTFGPDDDLPDWVSEQVKDEHYAETEESVADLPVAGPGQTAGEDLTDEEKAEARKKNDRERKAAARAAAKKQSDDEAAVKAAQEAEA
jgi:hypothetical protein